MGLGVIFGIIIDTFSELRDEKVCNFQPSPSKHTVTLCYNHNQRIIDNGSAHTLVQACILQAGCASGFTLLSPDTAFSKLKRYSLAASARQFLL